MNYDQNNIVNIIISITDVTDCITNIFYKRNIPISEQEIYSFYDNVFRDIFFSKREYLSNTLEYLKKYHLYEDKIYNEASFVYNQLYYAIDRVGLTDNKYYLDKVTYDLINLDRLKLTYDPKADTRLRSF